MSNKQKQNKMENQITKFEVGNIYEMRFIGDNDLRPQFICVKRTAKTATFECFKGTESLTRRIKEYDNSEYILEGNYSKAPRIKANKVVG